MEHNMILSASGWRKVFAISGNEQDNKPEISQENRCISVAAAKVFYDYIIDKTGKTDPAIAVGIDTRPTGVAIADAMIRFLAATSAKVKYCGISSAPEIMAYAKQLDGFIYISASHNPVGHNGIKFGTNEGGVLNGTENAALVKNFLTLLNEEQKLYQLVKSSDDCNPDCIKDIYDMRETEKNSSLKVYESFIHETITGSKDNEFNKNYFESLKSYTAHNSLGIVCDFNGSSRAHCIDKDFFSKNKINFYSINNDKIVHGIIPEAENLVYVANEMERLQAEGHKEVLLGYMPDCDGDRGNIVFWNEKNKKAEILKAQEVFALSAMAETAFLYYQGKINKDTKTAVVVNDPTSMRIDKICTSFNIDLFRAEVGEANVVNLAREKRLQDYTVRIMGEGSNGGNITHPAAVRDPLNTLFALIKLLTVKDTQDKKGLFHIWCTLSEQENLYRDNFSLSDVIATLPAFTTTGVSEKRAVTKVTQKDHSKLKAAYQHVFEKEWEKKKAALKKKYDISSYEAICNNGTTETRNVNDFSISGKGGLKILFKDSKNDQLAFIWMRGSGTEPVFRVMCDFKGDNKKAEARLLAWHTKMIQKADKLSIRV